MDSPIYSDISSPAEPDTPATRSSDLFNDSLETLLRNFPLEDQHILVTGGLGFIGSHTTLELLKANYNVIVIDNLSNSYHVVFDRIKLLASEYHEQNGTTMPQLRLHAHDYRDTASLQLLLEEYRLPSRWGCSPKSKIAGVIHFAAHKAVEESIQNPLKYYRNNVSGLIDFATTLGNYGIKTFIFSSSATVYGTLATLGLPLKEELCVHKEEIFDHEGVAKVLQAGCTGITNPYGRTKWMCESILADLAVSDPEWTVVALRYFNPIGCDSSGLLGEDQRQVPTNLLPVIVKVMTAQYQELQIFGIDWETADGTAVRDFIHVTDLAQGHIAALSTANKGKLRENFRIFNLGTGSGHSVMEVVNTMELVSSTTIPRKAADRRAGDVGSCVAAASRAREELGWKTEKTLKDACVDICKFLDVSGLSS